MIVIIVILLLIAVFFGYLSKVSSINIAEWKAMHILSMSATHDCKRQIKCM